MSDLRLKTISGLKWSALSQIAQQLLQLLVVFILLRILAPKDFGIVAMVTVITGFLKIFTELGLTAVIVQQKDLSDSKKSSAFWITVFLGLIMAVLVSLCSPVIAWFYGNPELVALTIAVSIGFVFSSFSLVQSALLRKEMCFKALMIRDVGAQLLGGGVGIIMALHGGGAWAIVAQLLVVDFVGTVLLWNYSKWRPQWRFYLSDLNALLPDGGRIMGFNCVNYFARNADTLLIGKFLGAIPLGVYGFAYRIVLFPIRNVTGVISSVFLSTFSKIQEDTQKVAALYLRLTKAVAMITFPAMALLFIVAPEFILICFGNKWELAVVPLRILCVCGAVQSIQTTTGTILLSQSQNRLYLELGVKGAIVLVAAVVVGLFYGIVGVAFSYMFCSILWWAYSQNKTNQLVGIRPLSFISNLYVPFTGSILLLIMLVIYKRLFLLTGVLDLAVISVAAILLYSGFLMAIKEIALASDSLRIKVLHGSV